MSKGHHRGKGCHSQNEPLFFLSFCSTKVFNFDLCTLARMENLNKTVKAQSNSVKAQKWQLNGIQKNLTGTQIFFFIWESGESGNMYMWRNKSYNHICIFLDMFTVDQTGNLESDRYSGTGVESRAQVSKCTSSCPFGWFGSGLMSYLNH